MEERPLSVLYEVYDKRVLHQGLDDLPLLDRGTRCREMERSANHWGGCVVRVECHIITERPMQREVVRWRVIYTHHSHHGNTEDVVKLRHLKGNLQQHYRPPRGKHRKR